MFDFFFNTHLASMPLILMQSDAERLTIIKILENLTDLLQWVESKSNTVIAIILLGHFQVIGTFTCTAAAANAANAANAAAAADRRRESRNDRYGRSDEESAVYLHCRAFCLCFQCKR